MRPTGPNAAERQVYRRALRNVGILLGGLATLGVGVGAVTAGSRGVWGAVIGVALAAMFALATIWSVQHGVDAAPVTMGAWVLGTWALKLAILIAALAWLRGQDFYHPMVLFIIVCVGALGAAGLEAQAVLRGRIPYVAPDSSSEVGQAGSEAER